MEKFTRFVEKIGEKPDEAAEVTLEREWAEIEALKLQGPTIKEFLDMPDEYWQSPKFLSWVDANGIKYVGQKFWDRCGRMLCETRKELYNFCENGYKA